MNLPPDYRPEFDSLKELLLEMMQERSVDQLLSLIARRFASRPHVALVRIWLRRSNEGEEEECERCAGATGCARKPECLHLAAGAGTGVDGSPLEMSLVKGHVSRLPFGGEGVGKVASTGAALICPDIDTAPRWFTRSALVVKEKIRSISATPLVCRGEILGVMEILFRIEIPPSADPGNWFHIVVDQAAAAISSAREFEDLERSRKRLEHENAYLREESREARAFDDIIGESAPMRDLRKQIDLVARTDASVLISGDTGTGKELVAREIHRRSGRGQRALITVNCAAVPGELWESEFFGHVKGAFTGAVRDRPGRFELAHGGTLFLDEVAEIPPASQSRLLRVLQEGRFERVGEAVTRQVDVRIIAATNRDLDREVSEGRFRKDLFFRLNVFPVRVVPLRDRGQDVELLAAHFARAASLRVSGTQRQISRESLGRLGAYAWPGNVRELQNLIERAAIISLGEFLEVDLGEDTGDGPAGDSLPVTGLFPEGSPRGVLTYREMKKAEELNVRRALELCGGQIYGDKGAAKLLGMKPTTLASRVNKFKG